MTCRLLFTIAAALLAFNSAAQTERYPLKPLRIVTAEVGGGNDYSSRVIAAGLTSALGQQVVVENRGGTPVNSVDSVMRAAPDGYTLLLNGSNMWMLQYMRDNVPYDMLRDLAPVTLATSSPCILVVHPSLPVKSVKELIALARARPKERKYAAAVTSAQPSKLFPQLPTIAATGLPGYESVGRFAVFAPLKTPEALVARINQEIVRVLAREEAVTRLNAAGIEPVGSTPVQLTVVIKSEMATLGKVIRNAGIRVD